MAKFAVSQFHKHFWTLLKRLTGNLVIIPYLKPLAQILLTRLKCRMQRVITKKKIDRIF